MNVVTKRPGESYNVAIEFASRLPAGGTLASGTVAAVVHSTGVDATSTVLVSGTATISGTQAIFGGQAGTSPNDYLITLTATLGDGSHLIEEILLQVRLAMGLIATPSDPAANSYCTRVEADSYHQTNIYNTDWLSASDWQKESALIMATRILDQEVDWYGYVTLITQALLWPRTYVLARTGRSYLDSHSIPQFLKNATAQFAASLLVEDRTQDRVYGMKSVKADTVDVVFDKLDPPPVIPYAVQSIIAPYGEFDGQGSGWAKLVRA